MQDHSMLWCWKSLIRYHLEKWHIWPFFFLPVSHLILTTLFLLNIHISFDYIFCKIWFSSQASFFHFYSHENIMWYLGSLLSVIIKLHLLCSAVSWIGGWSLLSDGHGIWQTGEITGKGRSCSFISETYIGSQQCSRSRWSSC